MSRDIEGAVMQRPLNKALAEMSQNLGDCQLLATSALRAVSGSYPEKDEISAPEPIGLEADVARLERQATKLYATLKDLCGRLGAKVENQNALR